MLRSGRMLLALGLAVVGVAVAAGSAGASTDSFSVTLPLNTVTDSLGAGAANLEASTSEDDYTFTLSTAGKVEIDTSSCPGNVVNWAVVNASAVTVASASGLCGQGQTSSLAAGTYTLKVTPFASQTGTYVLKVFVVPPPDAFTVSLPLNTATDTLGAGQGNLETTASEDDYTFTLSAARRVHIDTTGCPGGVISWGLYTSGGSSVTSGGCGFALTSSLAAGTYTLRVTPQSGQTGTYALSIPVPPANDDFANAQTISGVSGTQSGTTVGATPETGEPYSLSGVDLVCVDGEGDRLGGVQRHDDRWLQHVRRGLYGDGGGVVEAGLVGE